MKTLRVNDYNTYIVKISDEDYQELQDGNIDITEFLSTDNAFWKNGGTDYDLIKED